MVIVTLLAISFSLVEMSDKCILEVLWNSTLLPYGLEDVNQLLVQYRSTIFIDFSWYSISPRCLVLIS